MANPGPGVARRGGKKNRKFKRNIKFCEIYRREEREELNRARKMRRHLRDNPFDQSAASRYEVRYGLAKSVGVSARGQRLRDRAKAAPSPSP
jgi:hypothetical protein